MTTEYTEDAEREREIREVFSIVSDIAARFSWHRKFGKLLAQQTSVCCIQACPFTPDRIALPNLNRFIIDLGKNKSSKFIQQLIICYYLNLSILVVVGHSKHLLVR